MEPYAELGEDEMELHAEPGRWDKLEGERGGGLSIVVPVFWRAAEGVHRRAAEWVYRRAAEWKEGLVTERKIYEGDAGEERRGEQRRGEERKSAESRGEQRPTHTYYTSRKHRNKHITQ